MPVNVMTFNTLKPILDSRVNNIYFQEAPLYSRKIKTAGRVDLIAEFDGKLSIIDFKTSKKLKEAKWIEGYFMQESFYAAAFYELTQIPIKQIVTLIMVDDEKPQVFIEQPLKWLPQFIQLRNKYQQLHGI
jgi:genome maintenance exonuclease 1